MFFLKVQSAKLQTVNGVNALRILFTAADSMGTTTLRLAADKSRASGGILFFVFTK